MSEQNYTIWQRLGKVFGPDSTLDQQANVFKFDKKEILKTKNVKLENTVKIFEILRKF